MSITTIIAALQAQHAAITDVRTAPTTWPIAIAAGDCPYVLVDPIQGETRWADHGGTTTEEDRMYRVRCFVLPLGLGEGVDQARQLSITLLDRFLASYEDDPDLTSDAYIRMDRGIRDSGVVPTAGQEQGLVYGDQVYCGFQILLPIQERVDE